MTQEEKNALHRLLVAAKRLLTCPDSDTEAVASEIVEAVDGLHRLADD